MNQSISTQNDWFNKNDENFFLFSLNQLRCYRPVNDFYKKNGCFHSSYDQGPIFGNSNSNFGAYGALSILCENGGMEFEIKDMGINEKFIFSGKSKFTIKELEVYKIVWKYENLKILMILNLKYLNLINNLLVI